MRKKISGLILGGVTMLGVYSATAQSYVETALLFSRTRPGGSARIQGAGGAQIALGGDYSSGLSNPAGLGMFNRSEFTFTPAYSTYTTDANYLGNQSSETKTGLNIPGLSFVFNMPKQQGAFLGGSLGVSFTRTNDFHNNTTYSGINNNTSIIDYFIDDAFGFTTAQFSEGSFQFNTPTGLSYYNYLIGPASLFYPDGSDTEYETDIKTIPFQREDIQTTGATNQWSISYGGNFNDMIFFGGGIGITSLRYKSKKIFSEEFDDPYLFDFGLEENLDIRGSGINATLGLIARPVNFIQVGVSFTTPTFYQLSESYRASMYSNWKNFDYYGDGTTILNDEFAETDILTSDYNLTTPMKFSAGVAFISKYGFISGDIELMNPSKAKYSSDTPGISYPDENDGIQSTYQSVTNIRVGGEFRYQIFRLRAGYGMQGNAYNSGINLDNKITTLSAGAGIRQKNFFVDLAWVQNRSATDYFPYSFFIYDLQTPVANFKNTLTTTMITVGFTF